MDKISCVIVDDDAFSREMLSDHCRSVPFIDLVGSYNSPQRFLDSMSSQKFDICLLDMNMPGMTGVQVAQQLDGQSVIFVTAEEHMLSEEHMLKNVLSISPIGIVLKPIEPKSLNDALTKAFHQLNGQRQIHRNGKECELLNVDGVRGKVKFRVADIIYIHSDKDDPRHKYITTRDGDTQRAMDCKFEKLLALGHNLVRINCSEAVSLELVKSYGKETVIVEDFTSKSGGVKELMLNRTFRKEFKRRIEVW
ncbi:MAG TPA: response regulator transcription factor [Bacteroidia bacterium]|nr:response regulator transcription factor [Bacteroidia bacterium]